MMLTLIEYFDISKKDRIESGRYQQIGNLRRSSTFKVSFSYSSIRRLFNFLLRVLPICELSTPELL